MWNKFTLTILLSTLSILAILSSLTSTYAQENVQEIYQIPETAKGPEIPSKGYLVEEIKDNLFWVTDGIYNTMFMVTNNGVIAVDAPPSIGENYLKAISEVTEKPITHLIYSHAHLDHIGASGIFPENITIIAHEKTLTELENAKNVAMNKSSVPKLPTDIFTNNYTLQIGNQILQLDHHGNNHMGGNTFIYAPNQKVLMLVDVIFPGWVPFPYLAVSKDIAGYIETHDIVLNNYDFEKFVGGHLTRLGTVDDVIVQKEFISDLKEAASNANRVVSLNDIAQQVGSFDNPWLIFSEYINAVNEKCEKDMLEKWENKLGGAREVMLTHCFTMTEEERIDPTVQALLQNSSFVTK